MAVLGRRTRTGLLLLAVLGAAACSASNADSPEEITLRSLSGTEFSFEPEEPGEPMVIHFWASWCPSCVEELPHLDRLVRDRCKGRVQVLAVNLVESSEAVSRVVRERGLSLEVVRDPDGALFRLLAGGSMPANYFRTPDGVSRSEGPMSAAAWSELLDKMGCRGPASSPRASAPGSRRGAPAPRE